MKSRLYGEGEGLNQTAGSDDTINLLSAVVLLLTLTMAAGAQSVRGLRTNYSGTLEYDAVTGTVTFTKSGTIRFPNRGNEWARWNIPSSISTVVIGANVQVTGMFHASTSYLIRGQDRHTSVVYGTPERNWLNNYGPDADHYFAAFYIQEGTQSTLNVQNLTSLNPFGFHMRAWNLPVHLRDCDFLDTRGGIHESQRRIHGRARLYGQELLLCHR